jgi:hypothetical protein
VKVYVASSWRNEQQPDVVRMLRAAGHDVYDFRNPKPGDAGFQWSAIDPAWTEWSTRQFIDALTNPIAISGRVQDEVALHEADAVVLVTPCGRSAHLELGMGIGFGKYTVILATEAQEPELMYGCADRVVTDLAELVDAMRRGAKRSRWDRAWPRA